MPKTTLFSLKNRKNRPALGRCPQAPYASGGWGLRPQIPTLALCRYENPHYALNYNRRFHVT